MVEDVEGEGDHIDIGYDPDSEIEYDEEDPISAEQAVYDLGVEDAGGADENEEFDDDVFEEKEDE